MENTLKAVEKWVKSHPYLKDIAALHTAFEKCARGHLNSPEIKHKLYQKGLSEAEFSGRLEDVVFPVYQSAKSMGFSNWRLRVEDYV